MVKRVLVTGITGQDGSYLAERCIAQGSEVIGVVRDLTRARLVPSLRGRIELVAWDFADGSTLERIIAEKEVCEIYNFAAFSSGERMFDQPVEVGRVNGLSVAVILESIRKTGGFVRFCQASSSEMFGNAREIPQSEATPFSPRTPYGAAKLYAHTMVDVYRRNYGLFACSAILFNHESPRRGINFVTRKVTHAAAAIKRGKAKELTLYTLEARRDWGFAGDYVEAMRLMLAQERPEDYVIATGVTHSARELCQHAFGYLGLDYREYVRVEARGDRVPELVQLVGDATKARTQLRWTPDVDFEALIKMMVDAELETIDNTASQD